MAGFTQPFAENGLRWRPGVRPFARIEQQNPDTTPRTGAFVEAVIPDRISEGVVRAPETVLPFIAAGLRSLPKATPIRRTGSFRSRYLSA